MQHTALAWALTGALLATGLVFADEQAAPAAAPTTPVNALRDQAARIEAWAAAQPTPAWLTPDPAHDLPGLTDDAQWHAPLCEALGQCPSEAERAAIKRHAQGAADAPQISILVSRSLGAAALRAIFRQAAAQTDPPVRVVFRGILPGESLLAFMRLVHGWLAGIEPPPLVELDPTPFQETGTRSVPLMVLRGPQSEVARVAGLSNPTWLLEQVAAGRDGDLGTRGR